MADGSKPVTADGGTPQNAVVNWRELRQIYMEEQINTAPPAHDKDVEDNKVLAAIGYVWILCLIPLFAKKESKFAQFHAKQGLTLLIGWFLLWVVGWIPVLGWLVMMAGSITILVLSVLGIMNALQGKYWEMPVLGEYAKKINI